MMLALLCSSFEGSGCWYNYKHTGFTVAVLLRWLQFKAVLQLLLTCVSLPPGVRLRTVTTCYRAECIQVSTRIFHQDIGSKTLVVLDLEVLVWFSYSSQGAISYRKILDIIGYICMSDTAAMNLNLVPRLDHVRKFLSHEVFFQVVVFPP